MSRLTRQLKVPRYRRRNGRVRKLVVTVIENGGEVLGNWTYERVLKVDSTDRTV